MTNTMPIIQNLQSNSNEILQHPIINELMETLDLQNFKMPLVIKDKILMDEGKWNDRVYTKEKIREAFHNTDWSNRECRNLFLDHQDLKASEWIGEVGNIRIDENGRLLGDLIVHDLNTAIKLASGRPKMGISPKVRGLTDKYTKVMHNFVFDNFSLVINPAVKTAYINNSEVYPVTEDKLKLEDEEEQPKQPDKEPEQKPSNEEAEMAKKKQKYPYPEEAAKDKKDEKDKEDNELSAYTDFIKEKRKEGWDFKKISEEWEKRKKTSKMSELKNLLSDDKDAVNILKEFLSELESSKAQENPQIKQLEEKIEKMQESFDKIISIDAADRRTVNVEGTSSQQGTDMEIATLSQKLDDPNLGVMEKQSVERRINARFVDFLRNQFGGGF